MIILSTLSVAAGALFIGAVLYEGISHLTKWLYLTGNIIQRKM